MTVKVSKTRLPNGLTFLFQPAKGAASACLGLWVKLGSRHEDENEKGYTHFLEHMLFKGTKKRTAKQIASEVERVGGFTNAVTSREYTYFYITIQKNETELAFDILSDMIFHSTLSEKEVRSESNVIQEEMKGYEDDPEDFVYDTYYENIFSGYPIGRNILGTMDSIKSATSRSLKNYYKKNYHPARMILSFSGDFEPKKTEALTKKYFNQKVENQCRDIIIEPVKKNYGVNFIQRDLEQVNFLLGAEGFPRNFKNSIYMSLFSNIFGSGMSSRLFQNIREKKGLCYSISSFPSSHSDTGIVTISCGTSPDKFLFCLDSILEEVRRIKKRGVTAKELADSKTNQKGSIAISSFELPENKMSDIAIQEIYEGRFFTIQDRYDAIDKVKLDDLNEFISKIYSPKKLQFTGIGKIPEKELAKINTEL